MYKNKTSMLARRVVCCLHQSDCCIRVCISHQSYHSIWISEHLGYLFCTNHITAILQRITIKSPMVQLANANLPMHKIDYRCERVGLQSSTTY